MTSTGPGSAVAAAYDVDHSLGALADAIYLACSQIEEEGTVSTSTWNTLADAVARAAGGGGRGQPDSDFDCRPTSTLSNPQSRGATLDRTITLGSNRRRSAGAAAPS